MTLCYVVPHRVREEHRPQGRWGGPPTGVEPTEQLGQQRRRATGGLTGFTEKFTLLPSRPTATHIPPQPYVSDAISNKKGYRFSIEAKTQLKLLNVYTKKRTVKRVGILFLCLNGVF